MTTETKEQVTPQQLGLTSWEAAGGKPLHAPVFFVAAGGPNRVKLTYFVFPQAILLCAYVFMPGREPELWRRHWTSYLEAVNAADNLVADAEHYLTDTLKWTLRENEDLDFDDFVKHLKERINNEFH